MMKFNNIIIAAALALGMASSCTDTWDDHYSTAVQGEGSMWQAVSGNAELSNFTQVLKECGYESALSGSQVFTVFAPTNDTFTAEMRDSVISLYKQEKAKGVKDTRNKAIKEFIQNHIALYNYSVSTESRDSIVMMNGKYINLDKSSFGNTAVTKSNIQTSNGVLFTINEPAKYTPNVFEYIERDADLDSLHSFLYNKLYNVDYFLPSASVPGEIVDGQTIYLDSVTVLRNDLFGDLGELNDEDSTYWMVVPTNEAWKKQIERNAEMFIYSGNLNQSLRDSLIYLTPRLHMIAGSVFSQSYNHNIADESVDSVLSTNYLPYELRYIAYGSYDKKYYQYDKPYAAGGIFEGAEIVECSNGKILKTDDWRIKRNQTFLQDITMEMEYSSTLDSIDRSCTKELSYISVPTYNTEFYDKVSNHRYIELAPSGSTNAKASFNVTNVLSNTPYDLYVVMVPAEAADTIGIAEDQKVPTEFSATVYYRDVNGVEKNFDRKTKLTNDATKVDSVFVDTYTFPTCSYGLTTPEVKIILQGTATNAQVRNGQRTKTMRIDAIVLKPHEDE